MSKGLQLELSSKKKQCDNDCENTSIVNKMEIIKQVKDLHVNQGFSENQIRRWFPKLKASRNLVLTCLLTYLGFPSLYNKLPELVCVWPRTALMPSRLWCDD